MIERTPYQQARQIGFTIGRFASAADLDSQTTPARKSFEVLRRNVKRAEDALKDYEMFELEQVDSQKQIKALARAVKSLHTVRESMLKASEYDLIGAIDVAQLSVEIDGLISRLGH